MNRRTLLVALAVLAAAAGSDLVLSRGGPGRALADLLPAQASALRAASRLRREPGGWRVVGASWREIPLAEALRLAGEGARR